jgi:hypothetical protein
MACERIRGTMVEGLLCARTEFARRSRTTAFVGRCPPAARSDWRRTARPDLAAPAGRPPAYRRSGSSRRCIGRFESAYMARTSAAHRSILVPIDLPWERRKGLISGALVRCGVRGRRAGLLVITRQPREDPLVANATGIWLLSTPSRRRGTSCLSSASPPGEAIAGEMRGVGACTYSPDARGRSE